VQANTTFGVITGTRDPRSIQFGLKLNFRKVLQLKKRSILENF
jgi:hypothetical protein